MFSRAIVRTPSRTISHGLTSANLGIPDYLKALEQHKNYICAIEDCGLEVTILDAREEYPDATFVEDVALLTPTCAIVTNPGAESRIEEVNFMEPELHGYYDNVEKIMAPGTVEAGDIMMVSEHFYIGLSERTNKRGAEQLIKILEHYGMSGSLVELTEVLHLKTGLSYLEDNFLLACGEFLNKEVFQSFKLLKVDADESYAANSVWINGTVLVPEGFPKTEQLIKDVGYRVRTVNVSEFQKIDGGLSCLSLRF